MGKMIGSIEQRARSWRVIWSVDGKRQTRSFIRESDAVAFRERLTRHGGTLQDGDADALTVAALYDEWAHRYGTERRRGIFRTMAEGEPIAKAHIGTVTAEDLTDLADTLATRYAETTVRGFMNALRAAFRYAQKRDYIVKSPVPDSFTIRSKVRATVPVFLRDDEADRLIAAMPERFRLFTRVLLHSGIRIGEAYALVVGSVDVADDGRVTLTISANANQKTGALGPTKTRDSVRFVPLPRNISREVAELANGRPYGERLFTLPVYNNYLRAHKRAVADAGLLAKYPGGVRIHDMRHTYASRLLRNGMSLFQVSKWMGHSDVAITANLYGKIHVDDERLNAIVDALES